jgi:hypothetical protein
VSDDFFNTIGHPQPLLSDQRTAARARPLISASGLDRTELAALGEVADVGVEVMALDKEVCGQLPIELP